MRTHSNLLAARRASVQQNVNRARILTHLNNFEFHHSAECFPFSDAQTERKTREKSTLGPIIWSLKREWNHGPASAGEKRHTIYNNNNIWRECVWIVSCDIWTMWHIVSHIKKFDHSILINSHFICEGLVERFSMAFFWIDSKATSIPKKRMYWTCMPSVQLFSNFILNELPFNELSPEPVSQRYLFLVWHSLRNRTFRSRGTASVVHFILEAPQCILCKNLILLGTKFPIESYSCHSPIQYRFQIKQKISS